MDSESDIVNQATLYLREYERSASKKIRSLKYMLPWDTDWIRLEWRDRKELLPTSLYKRKIWLTCDKKFRPEKPDIVMDVGDYLLLQFLPESEFEKIMKVYEVFQPLRINKYTGDDINFIFDYCNKVDAKIVDVFFRMKKEKKINDVFIKLWKQMGGDLIRNDDRLGRRICYYKEIIERFKVDSEGYRVDVSNLHLLG